MLQEKRSEISIVTMVFNVVLFPICAIVYNVLLFTLLESGTCPGTVYFITPHLKMADAKKCLTQI